MEEVFVVRHRHLVEGVSIRRLAREMGIDQNTVRRYLRGAPPGVGKPRGVLGAPVHDTVQPRALEILEDAKRWTGGKQRLTAARLYTMLVSSRTRQGTKAKTKPRRARRIVTTRAADVARGREPRPRRTTRHDVGSRS